MQKWLFFNKEESTVDDLNLAFDSVDTHIRALMKGYSTKGWLEIKTEYSSFNIGTIKLPEFTQGSDVDKIDILVDTSPAGIIMGIDSNTLPIIISTNSAYQTANPDSPSGNQDIPLGTSPIAQPYDRYIWVAYRECTASTSRVDFDGALHYPQKYHGYEVVISTSDPSVYQHPNGLYVGKVHVELNVQTYDYGPSTSPVYLGRLTAGIADTNVTIFPDTAQKTSSYAADNTKRTLRDHINAQGDGTVNETNPHGLAAHNLDALSGPLLTQNKAIRNGLLISNINYVANTSYFQGTIYNTFGVENYVTVSEPVDGVFVIDGRVYNFNELSNYSASAAKVNFETLTAPADTGWYIVNIKIVAGNPTLTADLVSSADFIQAEDDDRIFLGYVYWDSTALLLSRNETQAAINGDPILPFYSWGIIDNKNNIKHSNEYYLGSKNYIPFTTETCYEHVGYEAGTISGTGSRNIGKFVQGATTRTPTSYFQFTLGTAVFTGVPATNLETYAEIYTLPNNLAGQKSSSSKTFYTLSFNYAVTTGSLNLSAKVIVNGITYYLPSPTTDIKKFFITIDSYPSFVRFETLLPAGGETLKIYGLQLVEGLAPTEIDVNDGTYTTKVYYNHVDVSKYTAYSTPPASAEKRIKDTEFPSKTLDRLLLDDLAFVSEPIKLPADESTFDTYPAATPGYNLARYMTANVGSTLDNIVIYPFQGIMTEGSPGEYAATFTFLEDITGNTRKFLPIAVCPGIVQGDVAIATEVIENVVVQTYEVAPTPTTMLGITISCNIRQRSAFVAVTGRHLYVQGIALLKKIS